MGTDPFAHGTPVGDYHTWVDPGRMPCPDCPCCTVNLCRTAADRSRTCAAVGAGGPGVMDLRDCPCNAERKACRPGCACTGGLGYCDGPLTEVVDE